MKVKILKYPCKGHCIGMVVEAIRYNMPEPGYLVHLDFVCPAKKGFSTVDTTCFIEDSEGEVEIIEK